MYIIRSGKVKVFISRKGKTIPFTLLGKGSYVGEMSFLSGVPRSATVVVVEPVTASMVTSEVLNAENQGISEWAISIAKVLVERIRKTTAQVGGYLVAEKGTREKEQEKENDAQAVFRIQVSPELDPGRLYLQGSLTSDAIEPLKLRIRELRLKNINEIVLDFSEIIDIDNAGLSYLFELTQHPGSGEKSIKIENIQLIRSKVLSIKGILSILSRTPTPVKRLSEGDFLIRQGELENTMYVVKTGKLEIFRKVNSTEVILGTAEPGDVIGEMSLIKEGTRSANVRAVQSSNVYIIETQEFYKNMYNIPGWFFEVTRGLVQRLRHTNAMLDSVIRNKKKKEKKKTWSHPLGIVIDSGHPGKFILQGELLLDNLDSLSLLINALSERGVYDITIDLGRVKKIDQESITYLLHLSIDLKRRGGFLTLLGPQKDIIKLKRQYDMVM